MKKAFLLGLFLVLFVSIISLAIYKWIQTGIELSTKPSPSPVSSPSMPEDIVLPKLGSQSVMEAKAAILQVVEMGVAAIPELKKVAKNGNEFEMIDALEAMRWIALTEAVEIARGMLSNESVNVRIKALEVLSRGGNSDDGKKALERLSVSDPLERVAALTATTFILREKAIPDILNATNDTSAIVRAKAIEALEALTWQTFGLKHSGYPSDETIARSRVASFLEQFGEKTRMEWLTMRVESELEKLWSEEFFARYDAAGFFDKIQLNAGYDPWLEPKDSAEQAEEIRKRWDQTKQLFAADVPLLLSRETE